LFARRRVSTTAPEEINKDTISRCSGCNFLPQMTKVHAPLNTSPTQPLTVGWGNNTPPMCTYLPYMNDW